MLDSIESIIRCSRGRAEQLGLSDRGVIRRKALADLLLFERPGDWPGKPDDVAVVAYRTR